MAIEMPLPLEIIVRFSLGRGQRRFTRFVAMASLIGMMLGSSSTDYGALGDEWLFR